MAEVKILGPDGRPVRKQELTREVAAPTLTGVRQVWQAETLASGLTPQRLARLLRSAAEGDPHDYLTLAEEMEERDPHYASVLSTRKRAVSGLEPVVESVSDDRADLERADAVREVARRPGFPPLVEDALDALGKGHSAVEILWDRSPPLWRPQRFEWRDPRWFRPDRSDGRTLRLRAEADSFEGIPLPAYKFIQHLPHLKSGLPIRGGLARLAAVAYLCKTYTVTDWVAFAEVFGMPLRLGRYGQGATEGEIQVLMHAVANLGTDAAAVLPEAMRIEFTEPGNRTEGAKLFEQLASWLDKQVSKAVLGQTMTADDGSSRSQAEVHDAVRRDILISDARQLAETLNRDLVVPFIDLNFGPQPRYPRLTLPVPDPEETRALAEVLERLVPLGLRVEASVVRDRLGLPDPEEGAELLRPSNAPPAPGSTQLGPSAAAMSWIRRALQAKAAAPLDDLDEREAEAGADWEEQLSPVVDPLHAGAESAESYEEFLAGLDDLLDQMDPSEMMKRLARTTFRARGLGDGTDAP